MAGSHPALPPAGEGVGVSRYATFMLTAVAAGAVLLSLDAAPYLYELEAYPRIYFA